MAEQDQRADSDREAARLAILYSYNILDTAPEQGFDDIVLLATQLCETPVALVSLVAGDRQWFKARIGFDPCQTPLSQSVCALTLWRPGLLIIPDLTLDPRTRDNTLVTDKPSIRFYAGARLETPDGMALGSLCVIDTKPRPEGLTEQQQRGFEALARQVMAQLELRRSMATLETRVAERAGELNLVQDSLRQSQKMEAVGQLTGGLAHDFNNLLAVVTGNLELMAIRLGKGRFEDLGRFMASAQTAAKRATALTHRLLAFSRRQTLDPKAIGIDELVEGMRDMVNRTVGPEIAVDVVTTPKLWTALVDPNQLENALLNLCINARDAMPDGGQLTIETSNQDLGPGIAAIRDLPPGQYVALSVSDTGSGMTPEIVARVFEPFFTTKPTGQGTGLGLSMVYGFARQSGGQVRIHSEVGRGTTVTIYLPRSDRALITEGVVVVATPQQAERGRMVLVVDDEAAIRVLIGDVLRDLGYGIIEAETGPAALQILQTGDRIDLLITDVGMPGMNGRQLADAARVGRPDLKTLFITGYAEASIVSHGHLDAGMEVMTKPFAVDVLANRVKGMIDAPAEG